MRDRFVWQQVKRDVLKTMSADCTRCQHCDRCEGIWATYGELYGLDELLPL